MRLPLYTQPLVITVLSPFKLSRSAECRSNLFLPGAQRCRQESGIDQTLERPPTPYEKFLMDSLQAEKQSLDNLYNQFAHANPVKKHLLKRQIDAVLQNIKLVSDNLEKYRAGLAWLREKSKERDELAEKLGEIKEEETPKEAATPAAIAKGQTAARPTIGRPVIGKQVSTPTQAQKPTNQQGPAAQAQSAGQPPAVSPQQQPQVSAPRPVVGRPVIGKPIGQGQQPAAQTAPQPQPQQQQQPQAQPAAAAPPRPRIGTPIGKPIEKKKEEEGEGGSSTQ